MSRYAIYARVSTEEQARGANKSLDNQIFRCQQYLKLINEDEEVIEPLIYREEGFSGKNTNRPMFQQLMADVYSGVVTTIVFTELSRVSRCVMDFLALVDELNNLDVSFISLRQKFDTTTPTGRLILTIFMALNQFEREQISSRTSLNIKARTERGLWFGGQPPLGYIASTQIPGHLDIDPHGAEIVQLIFKKYLEFGSVSQVLSYLKKNGIKRPEITLKDGTVKPPRYFSDSSLRNLLHNPTVTGQREVNRVNRNLPPERLEKLPEADRYFLVKGAWDGIIDLETFTQVQELMQMNRSTHGNVLKELTHNYLLSGLVFCGECHSLLEIESSKKNTYHYYRHPGDTSEVSCTQKRWSAKQVEDMVLKRLSILVSEHEIFKTAVDLTLDKLSEQLSDLEAELEVEKKELSLRESEYGRLISRLSAHDDPPAGLWEEARNLEVKIGSMRRSVDSKELDIKRAQVTVPEANKTYEKLLEKVPKLNDAKPSQQRALVQSMLCGVELQGRTLMNLYISSAFSDLTEVKDKKHSPETQKGRISTMRPLVSSPCWTRTSDPRINSPLL